MEKVSYVTIHCSLHVLHAEKCPVTSGCIAICMPHIWKMCLLCHDTLQFACITYGKCVCYVTIHCNLHALYTEKCPVMSGYIVVCMPHMWKRCLLRHNTLQFVCLTYGKSVCHVMHSNLHAVLFGMGGSLLHHDTLQFACIRYKKNSCYV